MLLRKSQGVMVTGQGGTRNPSVQRRGMERHYGTFAPEKEAAEARDRIVSAPSSISRGARGARPGKFPSSRCFFQVCSGRRASLGARLSTFLPNSEPLRAQPFASDSGKGIDHLQQQHRIQTERPRAELLQEQVECTCVSLFLSSKNQAKRSQAQVRPAPFNLISCCRFPDISSSRHNQVQAKKGRLRGCVVGRASARTR